MGRQKIPPILTSLETAYEAVARGGAAAKARNCPIPRGTNAIKLTKRCLGKTLSRFRRLAARGQIPVWRVVTVEDVNYVNLAKTGVFWADRKDCARGYWSAGSFARKAHVAVKLHATVDPNEVDWRKTLVQRLEWGDRECEITLRKGATVRLKGYTVAGGRRLKPLPRKTGFAGMKAPKSRKGY